MRWLALDVGSRRVGLAICDGEERVATALPPVSFAGAEALATRVGSILAEREIEGIVVGVPLTRLGQGRGEARVAAVVAALRSRVKLPVVTIDESGTTAEAERLLAEAGVPRRRWDGLVDGIAAQLILQAHMAARARELSGASGER